MATERRPAPDGRALRAEHDALAAALAARASIDHARRGAYLGFAALIAVGVSVKLGFDRWFSTHVTRFRGPPVFFYVAAAMTVVLVAAALLEAVRARRLMREEDARFARLQELRRRLELDP
jgi:cation transport ATPase